MILLDHVVQTTAGNTARAIAYRRHAWSRLWTNWWTGGWRRSSICAGPDAARRCCSTRAARYSTANWANTPGGRPRSHPRCWRWRHEPPGSFRSRFKYSCCGSRKRGPTVHDRHLAANPKKIRQPVLPELFYTLRLDLIKILRHQLERSGADVLLQSMYLRRSWNRNDPRLLREQPGQCDLCGTSILSSGDLIQKIHQRPVCVTSLLGEP